MPTVTDEDVLELVDRFDIPLEDTVEVEGLKDALREKLSAAGVDYVSEDFLGKFQYGIGLKFETLPEARISFKTFQRPSTVAHPGGWWQPVYRDTATGRFISRATVMERVKGLQL